MEIFTQHDLEHMQQDRKLVESSDQLVERAELFNKGLDQEMSFFSNEQRAAVSDFVGYMLEALESELTFRLLFEGDQFSVLDFISTMRNEINASTILRMTEPTQEVAEVTEPSAENVVKEEETPKSTVPDGYNDYYN